MAKEVVETDFDNSSSNLLLEVITYHLTEEPECRHSLKYIAESILPD